MKRAVLGGTFDPVSKEHVAIAVAAIKELKLDEIFIVPTFISPHKNGKAAPPQDRFNMLKIAFSCVKGATVCDFEIKSGGKSYTYITAEYFREKYPLDELYFIAGEDMLTDFKNWKEPQRILNAANLAVFKREGYAADFKKEKKYFKKTFGKTFLKMKYRAKEASSTEIRVYNAFSLCSEALFAEVKKYIDKKGLYAPDKYTSYISQNLPIPRVIHTANVVVCALKKAKELNLSEEKVTIAATLHDCAKYEDEKDYAEFNLKEEVPRSVVHQFLGAYIAEKVLGVEDGEILDAIRYHTSGKAGMTELGKLIFVADMIEKGRDYDGVEKLRALYEKDFDECFKECLKEEYLHLKRKKKIIYGETVNAYNYYINGEN